MTDATPPTATPTTAQIAVAATQKPEPTMEVKTPIQETKPVTQATPAAQPPKKKKKKSKKKKNPNAANTVNTAATTTTATTVATTVSTTTATATTTVASATTVVRHTEPIIVGAVKPKEELPAELKEKLLSAVGKNISGETVLDTTSKHAFWKTQPVPGLGVKITADFNHPIEPDKKPEEVPKTPVPLPAGYHFCVEDVMNAKTIKEIYTLLNENYVEDDDNMFRFDYSVEFLRWALTPPDYFKDWHVGVRHDTTNALYGFITGIPATIRVYDRVIKLAEINFLCVHKSLRTKRLAPILIQEVTRRVHLQGMFQAVYTAGVVLPNPVSSCSYYHRSLNPRKLIEVGFSSLGPRMTMSRLLKLNRLPDAPVTPGLRPMTPADVPEVSQMLANHLTKFSLTPLFSEAEVAHWFLPHKDVILSYVVQDPKSKALTGFLSFYALPSSVLGNPKHSTLRAAYSYYNVNNNGLLKDLINDGLILAKNNGFDVFNCLDVMDNEQFLKDLKFGIGDGKLQYYVFNWACPTMQPKNIGLVLL